MRQSFKIGKAYAQRTLCKLCILLLNTTLMTKHHVMNNFIWDGLNFQGTFSVLTRKKNKYIMSINKLDTTNKTLTLCIANYPYKLQHQSGDEIFREEKFGSYVGEYSSSIGFVYPQYSYIHVQYGVLFIYCTRCLTGCQYRKNVSSLCLVD